MVRLWANSLAKEAGPGLPRGKVSCHWTALGGSYLTFMTDIQIPQLFPGTPEALLLSRGFRNRARESPLN